MKTKYLLLIVIIMLFTDSVNMSSQTSERDKKVLIVYYSLRNGNTRAIAEHIQKNLGGDIFRIETVDTYPSDYNDLIAQAKKELQSDYKPPLRTKVNNFDQYDIICMGSPNWWNTIAPPVMTFLDSYNFDGKTILPFITHEGSRLGGSVGDIEKLAPKATVLKGLPVRGGSVDQAMPDVQKWLKDLEMIK